MKINLLRFDMEVGRQKPENIIRSENHCPFCHPEELRDILATDEGGIMLLKNKYNVIEDADQLVLIETEKCGVDMPDYSKAHMRRVITFGVAHWMAMEASGKYGAVLFFKNHGRYSGGTMRHAHMQLVGIAKADTALFPSGEDFDGFPVAETDGVFLNAATHPRLGFGEFNILAERDALGTLADYIQKTAAYICGRFLKSERSYNIFFYNLGAKIGVKMMPRFPTSPYLIGYDVRILPNNLEDTVRDFRATMF